MKNNSKRAIIISIVTSICTGLFIALFLSGKIISIPHGTHKGGIMGALGIVIILVSMFIISLLVNMISKRLNN